VGGRLRRRGQFLGANVAVAGSRVVVTGNLAPSAARFGREPFDCPPPTALGARDAFVAAFDP
jgi:hypothetical protein